MKQVLDLYGTILSQGRINGNRTGTNTQRIFGHQMRFNLADGFPLVTSKRVHLKSVIVELLWFLQGKTNAKDLNELGVRIWDEWATGEEHLDQLSNERIHEVDRFDLYLETIEDEAKRKAERTRFNSGAGVSPAEAKVIFDAAGVPEFLTYRQLGNQVGDLGPVYGKQWRSWACPDGSTIDQISETIELLKTKPFSRRIIVSAWNPADLPDESSPPQTNVMNGKMALAACHTLFQFFADPANLSERINYAIFNDREKFRFEILNIQRNPEAWAAAGKTYEEYLTHYLDSHGVPKLRLSCQLYQRKQNCALVA